MAQVWKALLHTMQLICLPSCPFMAHPLPSDPVGQRGPVFRRKHSTGHMTHTDTQTHHCNGTAGVRRWAGNGVYPLLEAISCHWVKLVYLSSGLSSLCACVHRSIHVRVYFKNPEIIQKCAKLSHGKYPQRVYRSALVAHVIDQVYTATCGIPQQILLPTDLINGPQTETVILHQTPTNPSFLPQ